MRGDVGGWSVAASRITTSRQTRVRGSHSRHPLAFSEQRRRREAGEYVDAKTFRLFAKPAHDLAEGRDVVAVILHRWRRRDSHGATSGQEIDPFPTYRRAEREILVLELREQRTDGDRIDDRARKGMFAERAGFLEHANLNVA